MLKLSILNERNSNDNEHLTQQQQQKYSTGNDSSAYIFVPSSLRRLNSNGCQKERKELHFLGYSSRQNRKKDIKPETISPKIKKPKEKKDQKMKRKMIGKKPKKKNDKKRVKRKRNEELEEFQEKFILSCLQLVWLLSSIEFEFHATRLLPSILTWIITPRWTSMVKICHEFPTVPATKISLQIIFELPTHFVSVSILCSIINFLPELFFLPTIPNPSTILAQFFISRKLSRDFEKEQIRSNG